MLQAAGESAWGAQEAVLRLMGAYLEHSPAAARSGLQHQLLTGTLFAFTAEPRARPLALHIVSAQLLVAVVHQQRWLLGRSRSKPARSCRGAELNR